MSKAWYVIQTQPNAEDRARAHLERQGFDVYLPSFWKSRRHARKTDRVKAPLFPRYMFIALDVMTERWRVVISTVGVSRMIGNERGPLSVGNDVIDGIRQREGEDGTIRLDSLPEPFRAGESVQIKEGPLSGLEAIFSGMTGDERVRLLLDFMGRRMEVRLPVQSVGALA